MVTLWRINIFRTLAVSLLSLLLCASVAFAEKPLVVASDPTFPPNEMLNKDKEIVGFSIDYIKAVGKEAGFDVQVKNIAWDGIFAALASNQVDVIAASVSITDKRKKAMLFTDPYYELHQAVVLPLGKEIKDLEELAGRWPDRHDCHGADHPRFQDQDDCEDLRRSGARL